jgi:alanyl aminopeptidase
MRTLALALAVVAAGCPARTPAPIHTTPIDHVTAPPPPDAPPPPAVAKGLEPTQPTLRLPRNFVATGYEARLVIDPARTTFRGAITIAGTVSERSSVIWLHGRHLDIQRAAATRGTPFEKPDAQSIVVTPHGDDLLELRMDPPLDPGAWNIGLEYLGELDELNTAGAFREVVAGNAYVFSQLEAIYARRVFPCIDEPDSKVPWQLTIDVPKGVTAVSNTAVAHETPLGAGETRYEFARTQPLPSYLVAFGVGPFEYVDAGKTKTGVPVRAVTLKGRGAEAAYAAKTTAHILELLEDWYGIPYPYGKLDLLTVPVTVGFGAMENPGLVTFSERLMLIDAQRPSWERRHRWVVVASHELAHQWFGDLVTTAFWDDIWLNEGFANWMEHKITSRFEPTWHDELAELDTRNEALGADSVVSARQIRQPIETQNDIYNVFDGITYDKGASVLNMFESYIGPDKFREGVRAYLQERSFKNATSSDFVAAISKTSGQDLAPAFATFLDQGGAPEIATKIQCGPKPSLVIEQHRYVAPGSPPPPATKPWILPICVAYDRDGKRAETCQLVDGNGAIALEAKRCPRWAMPNVNGRGYYRVDYSTAQVSSLRDEAWPQLSWTERRTVFFDVAQATRFQPRADKQRPLALGLSFVPKMLAGGDRFTIGDATEVPASVDWLVPDDLRGKYEAWMRASYLPGARQAGILPKDTDDIDVELGRDALLGAAVWIGHDPELMKQATELASSWRDLPPAVRGLVLRIGVDANPALFERVMKEIKTEPDRARREEMYEALGSVRDPHLVTTALALTLDPAIDFRDSMWLLFGGSNEKTLLAIQTFFREHKDALLKRMPQDDVTGAAVRIVYLFTRSCDAAKRDEVASYVTQTFGAMPGGTRAIQQAVEGMDQCIATRKLLEPQLRGWLGGYKVPKPPTPAKPPKSNGNPKP